MNYGRRPSQPRLNRGFTLLEMLVVMVLTALITTLLMGGLSMVYRLQSRFGPEIFNSQHGAMYADWFRLTINGLMPDYPDGPHLFRGEPDRLSGLTLSPLDQPEGALVPFAWSLRFNPQSGQTQLVYGDAPDSPPILAWPGNAGRFRYLDQQGQAHDNWPPAFGASAQLPVAIRLELPSGHSPQLLIAIPLGPPATDIRLRDLLKL
jgi:general secretion pathway protein J